MVAISANFLDMIEHIFYFVKCGNGLKHPCLLVPASHTVQMYNMDIVQVYNTNIQQLPDASDGLLPYTL